MRSRRHRTSALFVVLTLLMTCLLSGCGDDSHHDSPYDQDYVNAQRILGLGGTFLSLESGSTMEELLTTATRLSGALEKQPDTCEEQTAWITACGDLLQAHIDAGASPDDTLALQLIQLRDQLMGQLGGSTQNLCDEAQAARMLAVSRVYSAIALNPERKNELIAYALQLFGPPGDPASWSIEVEAARLTSLETVYPAQVRNPDALDAILEAVSALAGDVHYDQPIENPTLLAARMASLSGVYYSITRIPAMKDDLVATALDLTGPSPETTSFPASVQAARLASFSSIYEGQARNPEALPIIFEAVAELCGTIVYSQAITDQTVLAARMASFDALYAGVARNPGLKDDLVATALALTGPTPAPSTFSFAVQAARLASFDQVYEGQARNPEAISVILEAVTALSGTITYDRAITNQTVAAARMASFSTFFSSVVRNPDFYDQLLATALQLTGPTGDPATFNNNVQSARMTALGGLFEGLLRTPELAALLIEASEELMGPIAEPLCADLPYQVQGARMAALHSLYEDLYRLTEEDKETVLGIVEQLAGRLQIPEE
jgi:hypothetical protein